MSVFSIGLYNFVNAWLSILFLGTACTVLRQGQGVMTRTSLGGKIYPFGGVHSNLCREGNSRYTYLMFEHCTAWVLSFYHVGSEGHYKTFEPELAKLSIAVHGQMEKKKSKKPQTQPVFPKATLCLELPVKSVLLFLLNWLIWRVKVS